MLSSLKWIVALVNFGRFGRPVSRGVGQTLVAACAPHLLDPHCGEYHDDALYLVTARALAQGEGYRLASLPGAPPQTKYPPLYPALLAGLWRLWPDFPANLPLLKGLSLLCGAAALALAYLYLVRFRYAPRPTALAAGLLCATAGPYLVQSVVLLSEAGEQLVEKAPKPAIAAAVLDEVERLLNRS